MSSPSRSGGADRAGRGGEMRAPSFTETSDPAWAGLEGPGIRINADSSIAPDGRRSIRVRGFCRVAEEEVLQDGPTVLGAVSLVVVSGPDHVPATFPATLDAVVFEDDLRRRGRFVEAFFEVDTLDCPWIAPEPGACFVSATMGPYLSNVVAVLL